MDRTSHCFAEDRTLDVKKNMSHMAMVYSNIVSISMCLSRLRGLFVEGNMIGERNMNNVLSKSCWVIISVMIVEPLEPHMMISAVYFLRMLCMRCVTKWRVSRVHLVGLFRCLTCRAL